MTHTIQKWSDEAVAKLQVCFASTDWTMFRDSSDGIEEFPASVTVFINKCIDDVVPRVTVRTSPNQKPWITSNICTELKARATAFKEQGINPEVYEKSCYALRRTIEQARRRYRTKFEAGLANCHGLQKETQLRTTSDASITDELNAFYARFEASNIEARMRAPGVPDDYVIMLSIAMNCFLKLTSTPSSERHWTHSNSHTAPTDPQMMQSMLRSTLPFSTCKGTPTSECCSLTTAQNSTP